MDWVKIDSAEDVSCDCEVLLFDGCDYHLDYVEVDVETGAVFFANGTSQVTHYSRLAPPRD